MESTITQILATSKPIDQEVLELIETSREKCQATLEDPEFQSFVAELQTKAMDETFGKALKTSSGASQGELYIFVSFKLGEKALLSLAQQAKRYGGHLILKGFKEGSYKKTVESLSKIIETSEEGFSIDPELFENFHVETALTIILAKRSRELEDGKSSPIHDRIQGNVSVQYALEQFEKSGDCATEATTLLKKRGQP